MLDPSHVPPVAAAELLARFILFSKWFRSSDSSVRADAFMPHPHVELSMTRHTEASSEEIWGEGERIADLRQLTLYGRADVAASVFLAQGLEVRAAPIRENPNHANATRWPTAKPEQKMKALEVASRASFVLRSS